MTRTTGFAKRRLRRGVGTLAGCLVVTASLGGAAAARTVPQRAASHTTITTINLAVVPFFAYAATELGQVKGIFRHYGIRVVLQPASNVNITLAELHSGQAQLGYTSTALLLNGDEKGQGVRCVAPVENANIVIPSYPANAIMVAANSPIRSLAGLNGKTVALNQPGGSNELFLKAAVEKAGGNWSSISIITVPFADMPAALKSGVVQAAFEVPPFVKLGEQSGDQRMLADTDSLTAGLTPQCFMATNQFIDQHTALLTRFVQAQDQAILFASTHTAEANAEIPTVSGLPPGEARKAVPPTLVYTDDLAPSTIVKYEQFMHKYGFLNGPLLPLSKVAWIAPGTPMKKSLFNNFGKYDGPATAKKKAKK